MKLPIGERLKSLRTKNKVTQEELAERLGVSSQSVSRWETAVCYPDMELLPAIANFFEVTIDDLLGMDEIRNSAKLNGIFTKVYALECEGKQGEAIAVLREALQTYPRHDGLNTELALALSKSNKKADKIEAIALSKRLLADSTNEKIQSTVRANLCFLYRSVGQNEKAVASGRTLPHIWECREILLPELVSEDVKEDAVHTSYNIARQVLYDLAHGNGISFSLGYKAEDTVDSRGLLDFIKHNRTGF